MRRRDLLALAAGAVALRSLTAAAQQKAMPVIGLLHSLAADRTKPQIDAFREGLREAGYTEGRNLAIEFRWADGNYDRLPGLAAELIARNVDVLATGGGTATALAAKNATSTIPIVLCLAIDPARTGVVASLARPGGNITGVGLFSLDLIAKRIELISDLVPQAKVLALMVNPDVPTWTDQVEDAGKAAGGKALRLQVLKARTKEEIDAAFHSLAELHADALVVGADAFLYRQRDQLAALASRYAVPAVYELREHVDAGGLMSYGSNVPAAYRQAARIVGKILSGTRPADIPVEQPTKFELVINLKTAKALGLAVPPVLLARADEVIE
jgi:putative tryptophan/tyrosine transport system substrate-binding protein